MIYTIQTFDEGAYGLMRFVDQETYDRFLKLADSYGWDIGLFEISNRLESMTDEKTRLIMSKDVDDFESFGDWDDFIRAVEDGKFEYYLN